MLERSIRKFFHNSVFPKDSLVPWIPGITPIKHHPPVKTTPPKNLHVYLKYDAGTGSKACTGVSTYNPSESHPFDTVNRVRLMMMIMQGQGTECCGLHLEELSKRKIIHAHYPLHERETLLLLADEWLALHVLPWQQVRYLSNSKLITLLHATNQIMSCPVLSCPFLSSFHNLPLPFLSYVSFFSIFCLFPSNPLSSHLISSHL